MSHRVFVYLVILGILWTLSVVALGAWTRLADAGLGCPDWPGCYGHLIFPNTEAEIAKANQAYPETPFELDLAIPEVTHRAFAGVLGLLTLLVAVVAVRQRRVNLTEGRSFGGVLAPVMVVLVVIQALFGYWTVSYKLLPQVVMVHLGLGHTFFLLWVWLLVRSTGFSLAVPDKSTRIAVLALATVACQILLGGWLSANYAALACPDFPTCGGQWIPEKADYSAGFTLPAFNDINYLGGVLDHPARVAIHFAHRVGALLVLLAAGSLVWSLWGAQRQVAVAIASILTVQLLLGIANVVFQLLRC